MNESPDNYDKARAAMSRWLVLLLIRMAKRREEEALELVQAASLVRPAGIEKPAP